MTGAFHSGITWLVACPKSGRAYATALHTADFARLSSPARAALGGPARPSAGKAMAGFDAELDIHCQDLLGLL